MTPEQAIREAYVVPVEDSKPDTKWFKQFVDNAKDPWKITRLLVWLLRRTNNQSVELARVGKALAGATIMRQALEEIAQPHGCGCPEICHCFSGEGGREIAEAMREIASDALKNVPLIEAVKPFQLPAELIGARVGGFTLAQAPEGFESRPAALRGQVKSISDVPIESLMMRYATLMKEFKRRGVTIKE